MRYVQRESKGLISERTLTIEHHAGQQTPQLQILQSTTAIYECVCERLRSSDHKTYPKGENQPRRETNSV